MIDYYTRTTVIEAHCVKITCDNCKKLIEDKKCYDDGWFSDESGISAPQVEVRQSPFSMYFYGSREGNLCKDCAQEFYAEIAKWANQLNEIYNQFGITEDN